MDWAAFKTLSWDLISFFFISGSGGKERLADRGVYVYVCVYVCIWLTCYSCYCFGLIPTPTPAPLCFLLQAVPSTHTGNCFFFPVFSFILSFFTCASLLLTHILVFNQARLFLSVSLAHTDTWHWLPDWRGHVFYSTSWWVGRAYPGLSLILLVAAQPELLATQTEKAECVQACVCLSYYKHKQYAQPKNHIW